MGEGTNSQGGVAATGERETESQEIEWRKRMGEGKEERERKQSFPDRGEDEGRKGIIPGAMCLCVCVSIPTRG